MHMMMEPLLLFETIYIENRSIMELLKPESTWTSSVLDATYVGYEGKGGQVTHLPFRRIPVSESPGTSDANVLILKSSIAANQKDTHYEVNFQAGPSVWSGASQQTTAADGLQIDLIREDGSTLAGFHHKPGPWAGGKDAQKLKATGFSYTGDGSGDLRVRLTSSTPGSGRFGGAIDDLTIKTDTNTVFVENFDSLKPGSTEGLQADTKLRVLAGATVPSWEGRGINHSHAVDLGDGDFAVQFFGGGTRSLARRGGVITCGAVMTMTSSATRTLPITRGAWVNAVIFNDPPEPPPADVPPLPEPDEELLKKLTIRERFAEHRKREDCASCHKRLDPLGFALENYGPTGVWRDKYDNGREVDPSGILFNKHAFKTAQEFQDIILSQKHRFIRGFAAHVLSYSLGREVTVADSPTLDEITAQATSGGNKLRDMLKLIALSKPFHHKTIE
jgi:hypothetical protein